MYSASSLCPMAMFVPFTSMEARSCCWEVFASLKPSPLSSMCTSTTCRLRFPTVPWRMFCNYGVIHSVTEQTYPDSPIFNGTRIVKMTVTSPIPANLRVRVFYKGQPISCYICKKSHRAAECPLRDVCRRCRQPGHFAKDCTFDPAPAADPGLPTLLPLLLTLLLLLHRLLNLIRLLLLLVLLLQG